MSFYNFKLNDHSSFSTSSPSDSKNAGRFVHKTFEDFQSKNNVLTPQPTNSRTIMTNDGRGKFAVSGWKEKNVIAPGGDKGRFRLEEEPASIEEEIPEEIHALSITSSLHGITQTYSPVNIATLNSLGSPTSIRLVKLAGRGVWHTHDNTDEIFILLRGAINMLYRSRSGEEKIARVIGGELLCVPMRMQHCVVADEGTEVLLLEGNDVNDFFLVWTNL